MGLFTVNISKRLSATFEVEAEDEDEAWEKATDFLNKGDTSSIDWEPVKKSTEIDEIYEGV